MSAPMTLQPPTMARILPIHRMACPPTWRGMGATRPRPALDAESAEVLGNIKALL